MMTRLAQEIYRRTISRCSIGSALEFEKFFIDEVLNEVKSVIDTIPDDIFSGRDKLVITEAINHHFFKDTDNDQCCL